MGRSTASFSEKRICQRDEMPLVAQRERGLPFDERPGDRFRKSSGAEHLADDTLRTQPRIGWRRPAIEGWKFAARSGRSRDGARLPR